MRNLTSKLQWYRGPEPALGHSSLYKANSPWRGYYFLIPLRKTDTAKPHAYDVRHRIGNGRIPSLGRAPTLAKAKAIAQHHTSALVESLMKRS